MLCLYKKFQPEILHSPHSPVSAGFPCRHIPDPQYRWWSLCIWRKYIIIPPYVAHTQYRGAQLKKCKCLRHYLKATLFLTHGVKATTVVDNIRLNFSFSWFERPCGLGSPLQSHTIDTPHSVGLLWMSDRPVTETCTDNTQHSQQIVIHAPAGGFAWILFMLWPIIPEYIIHSTKAMYLNVTLRPVLATIVVVGGGKLHIPTVICIPGYPACNAHAP
jgi:hypothetical protein